MTFFVYISYLFFSQPATKFEVNFDNSKIIDYTTMLSTVVMKKTQILDSRTPENSRVLDGKIVNLDHVRHCSPMIFISYC